MICAILAMSQNRVIAREGRLPWDLPEDLAFFKKMTLEHPVIMGRKTFTSMGRPLPRRANIVISRNSQLQLPGATVVPSLLSAIEAAQKAPGADKIFVIGGAEVVREALPMIEEFYLTVIHHDVEGDTFLPPFEKDFETVNVERKEEPYPFSFIHYRRRAAR
jgi:dihydrofolate reductase